MKKDNLPALIMLGAGAFDCVLSIIEHLSPLVFTVRLLIVLVVFFVLGVLVKWIVEANFPPVPEVPDDLQGEQEKTEGEDATVTGAEGEKGEEVLENINAENGEE